MLKRRVLISIAVVAVSGFLVLLVIRSLQTVLHGTVIRKGWTKTGESWNAGGSEYYVLDVGEAQIDQKTAKEGVILRPTDAVPFQVFEKLKGRRVAVRGRFVEGVPFVPPVDSMDQYPVRLDPTVPILRGSGFEVYEIDPLD